MAMKPFAGYNFGDYFAHWLSFNKAGSNLPKIFHVNWFRKGSDGKFMWPGFGDNMRVLEWILKRVSSEVAGQQTAIGVLPAAGELNTKGLNLSAEALQALLDVDNAGWQQETQEIAEYLKTYGDRTPQALFDELSKTQQQLG